MATTLGLDNPFRYRGYYYDEESGLFYVGSRYYDPQIGRWINADEQFDTGAGVIGTNLYQYCANNPANNYDPTGRNTLSLTLNPSLIASLSGTLAGIMFSISASMASVKAAIATSWLPMVCVAATAIAIAGIIYAVNKVMALSAAAASTIAAVKSKINRGGPNKLSNYTVYVIFRKGTTDVEYVGITKDYNSRYSAHKRGPKFNGFRTYTMMPIATGLTQAQARVLEQTIITAYTIDTLKNMINSISPSKWGDFKTEFNQMENLLLSFLDPQ